MAEKLLYLGIALILAATIGGGLDGAGILKIPPLRNWKVQCAVGAIGAVVMILSLVALNQLSDSGKRAEWLAQMSRLTSGTVGVPPPLWDPDQVRYMLVEQFRSAGDDYDENCAVAAFLLEFSDKLDKIPDEVMDRMKPLPPTNAPRGRRDCYEESVHAAQAIQTRRSGRHGSVDGPVGYLPHGGNMVASTEATGVLAAIGFPGQDGEPVQTAQASATKILESVTAIGDEGEIYLGEIGPDGLGNDRTIDDKSPTPGEVVSVRLHVNVRASGSDHSFADHGVLRVLSPGTQVELQSLTSTSYQWAHVRVVALPNGDPSISTHGAQSTSDHAKTDLISNLNFVRQQGDYQTTSFFGVDGCEIDYEVRDLSGKLRIVSSFTNGSMSRIREVKPDWISWRAFGLVRLAVLDEGGTTLGQLGVPYGRSASEDRATASNMGNSLVSYSRRCRQ